MKTIKLNKNKDAQIGFVRVSQRLYDKIESVSKKQLIEKMFNELPTLDVEVCDCGFEYPYGFVPEEDCPIHDLPTQPQQ